MAKAKTKQQLTVENDELQARLQELEETLEAIRSGSVDAIVTSGPAGDRVYTLEGADHAYHTMVESMNEGAVTLLADGTILYANRQFGQMTGASPSEIVGRSFTDFVQASDRPIWSGFIQQAGADGLKAEIRLGDQSASESPVQISATLIDLNGTKALALVVTDLTESRRYEEIVAAERLSRYILEQSLEGVAVCIHGRILFASRRLHEIYGGNPLMQPFDKLFPLTMSESEPFSVEIPQSGTVVKNAEVSYQNPDGENYVLILNAGPLYGDDHQILGCLVSLTDITERKRGEEEIDRLNRELVHRLQELEAVFQTAPIGLAIAGDPEGRHIHGNPANEEMLGVPRGAELSKWPDSGPASYRTLQDGRELAVDELPMQRAAHGETVSGQIMDVVREDGSRIRLYSNASPLLDEQGRPRGAVGAFLDITELSRAEESLRESESRFREMAETTPDILFTARPDGFLDYINERGLAYAGLPAHEALGKGWVKVVHPQDVDRSVQSVAESRRTGCPYEVKQRLRAADGSYRWFMARARAIRDADGRIVRWFGTATDIHDMMMAEEALRASDEQFRVLIQNVQSAVALIDERGAFMIVNRSFLRMFELAEDSDILNINSRDWSLWQVFDEQGALLDVDEHPVRKAAQTGRAVRNQLIAMQAPGSTARRWILISAEPILDAQGRMQRLISTYHDITERKQAEDELRESEAKFRRLFENIHEMIAVYEVERDADGRIVDRRLRDGNPAFLHTAGVASIDEIRGQTPSEIFGKSWAERHMAAVREAMDTGEVRVQEAYLEKIDRHYITTVVPLDVNTFLGTALDITSIKRAEKALQKSEARFRLLSGTAGRLLATDDPQGLVKELCRDVMEFLDCQAFFNFMVDERAGRLRLNACAGIPEAEVRKLEWLDFGVAVCGCVARDGARIVAEDIFHTPDARTELVKSYGIQAYCCHPLKARDRLIGTLSFGTKTRASFNAEEVDLMRIVADQVAIAMQRIQAQQEIVESSQRLQLALEAGGMGLWAWDLQTNRMIWNSKEYELMGLPAGDGVTDAEEFFRYVHPEDAPDLRDALGEVIARGSLLMREFRIVRNGGQLRWLTAVGRVVRAESGQPLSIIGINYDVTDRKKILDVLRESEERFRGAFEQSFSGIVICDFEGRILEVNPNFCHMMGYTEQELVGFNVVDLTHPEDREIERAKAVELKEGRLDGFRLEKRYLGKGGRVIWAEIGMSALHDDRGNIVYALGMVEDITERKAAEEALRRSKDELEEKVNERTAELMLLLEELEKGRDDLRKLASELVMTEERERKRIAVTLHDEVAQTLAAAKMRLDLLKKVTVGQAASEVVDEARDLLMQSIRETRSLMTDISSPILYEMGLPAAVQNLAEQTSASYGLKVSHDVTGEFGNLGQELSVMIYQAVRELLQNVSKHSQARNVRVRVIAEDTGVRMIVADDGRGFEVGDVGLPRREGGFGLFSIRERVKSFHGSMQIESAPGEGTVVTVVLPSSLGKTEEIRDEDKASPRGRRRRKT